MHIRPTRETDAASYCDAVRAVAAEKWYLATVDGYSLEQTRQFVKAVVEGSLPQVMAVAEDVVVGFCDIIPNPAQGFAHVRSREIALSATPPNLACDFPPR